MWGGGAATTMAVTDLIPAAVSDLTFTKPLDSITGATAAYSLRKLRSAYAGSAVQLRRASDGALQNIGFTPNGNFDKASALSFIGASSATVQKWYDQINSNDLSQSTLGNQFLFQIGVTPVSPGVTAAYPCIKSRPVGSGPSFMQAPDAAAYKTSVVNTYVCTRMSVNQGSTDWGVVVGYPRTTTAAALGGFVWQLGTNRSTLAVQSFISGSGFGNNSSNPFGLAKAYYDYACVYEYNSTNNGVYYNGNVFNTDVGATLSYPNATGLCIGAPPNLATNGVASDTEYMEIIVFGADKSSSRSTLTSNLMSYFGCATPPASVSTYYTGRASDGFVWAPQYNFPGWSSPVQAMLPVSSKNFFPESVGDYYSQWKCTNINNGTAMWRFEVHSNDLPEYVSSTGERSELDDADGGWTGGQTIHMSYAMYVESPGFSPTTSWNAHGQYHYESDNFPPASFYFNLFGNNLSLSPDTSDGNPTLTVPITPDTWYDIFIIHKLAATGTGTDRLTIYVNGTKVVDNSALTFTQARANSNAGKGYWKVGIYRGDVGISTVEAVRYANLEVTNSAVTDISARILSPLAHPTHA